MRLNHARAMWIAVGLALAGSVAVAQTSATTASDPTGASLAGSSVTSAVSDVRATAEPGDVRSGIGGAQPSAGAGVSSAGWGGASATAGASSFQPAPSGTLSARSAGMNSSHSASSPLSGQKDLTSVAAGHSSGLSSLSKGNAETLGSQRTSPAISEKTASTQGHAGVSGAAGGRAAYSESFPDSVEGTALLSPPDDDGSDLFVFEPRMSVGFPDFAEREFIRPTLHVSAASSGSSQKQDIYERLEQRLHDSGKTSRTKGMKKGNAGYGHSAKTGAFQRASGSSDGMKKSAGEKPNF
jgi:hypothetical protein